MVTGDLCGHKGLHLSTSLSQLKALTLQSAVPSVSSDELGLGLYRGRWWQLPWALGRGVGREEQTTVSKRTPGPKEQTSAIAPPPQQARGCGVCDAWGCREERGAQGPARNAEGQVRVRLIPATDGFWCLLMITTWKHDIANHMFLWYGLLLEVPLWKNN